MFQSEQVQISRNQIVLAQVSTTWIKWRETSHVDFPPFHTNYSVKVYIAIYDALLAMEFIALCVN